MRTIRDIRSGESGQAVITAVLVSLAVALLGAVAVGLATHSTQSSAQNRKRAQSIAAAEAGINFVYSHLQTATPQTLHLVGASGQATCSNFARELDASTGSRFNVSVRFFDAANVEVPCLNPQAVVPAKAVITSVGEAALLDQPRRTMEAVVKMTAIRGGGISSSAIYSQQNINFASNITINGGTAADADIYTDATFNGATNQTVQGNIYAQEDINLTGSGGGAHLTGTAHAKRHVALNNGYTVRGSAIAATGNIHVDGRIDGDASAAGTITPSTPNVGGRALGGQQGLAAPPVRTFPNRTYSDTEYAAAGYTNRRTYTGTSACSDAATYLQGTGSGTYGAQSAPTVIRIQANCTLSLTSKVTVRNHLAIVTDSAVEMQGGLAPVGSMSEPYFNVILDTGYNTALGCVPTTSTNSTGPMDFRLRSNSTIDAKLRTVVRSGCNIHFNSNAFVREGQLFARGFVNLSSNIVMTFFRIEIPGDTISGFKEDVMYTREIASA